MKVLSLKEPYASLICNNKKCIETRSWKTNYRGELYIHASKSKIKKQDCIRLNALFDSENLHYSHIICKCQLRDCIYMTKEFIEDIKNNNYQEYLCGDYQVGRYAWILENVEPLNTPIQANGQLGIWSYYDEVEIMNLMNDIDYGWIDRDNNRHMDVDDDFSNNYILQSPKELMINKIGVCWDQVELERYYFKGNSYNVKTYFIVHYDADRCPTHTFLTYEKNGKYYWFEHSWFKFRGIHEYNTERELLLDVKNKFIEYELNNKYDKDNLIIYKYDKPKYHLNVIDFYRHCEAGEKIDI